MSYEKDSYINGYKVSLLLKQSGGVETYRVRDAEGKLCVLKYGVSDCERNFAPKSDLFISDGGGEHIIYRYINGETLKSRLLRLKKFGESETVDLTKGILSQLIRLHRESVVHSNLAPDNIIIELGAETLVPYIVGYGHLAPISQAGIDSDLNAVGKLIFQMLTGESPHAIKVHAGNMSLIETVMMKALNSEFASAKDMLCALEGKSKVSYSPKTNGPGFSAVAGMEALKEQLKSEVIDILADKEGAERYGIEIPNGMLLYGPPGCGKTFLAERFAEETGYNYQYVKSSDLASTYLHGSQEKIAALFEEARNNAPTILCFDEFDALVPRRDDINNASQSGEVNEFLSQLNNCGKDGVFVIATSNRPDKIDTAILRSGRIDYIVYVPIPDKNVRRKIFELSVKDKPHETELNYELLAAKTDGFLASDVNAVVQQAARIAFKSKSLISTALLLSVIKERKPSLSKSMLAEYIKIREKFENHRSDKGWKRVGFGIE